MQKWANLRHRHTGDSQDKIKSLISKIQFISLSEKSRQVSKKKFLMTETTVSFSLSSVLWKVQVNSIFTSLSPYFKFPTFWIRTTIISRTRYSWHRGRRQTSQQLLFCDWELRSLYLILLDLKLCSSCNPPSRSNI